ncbi:hypothetical protein SKC42_10310 [Mycobacterium sp. 050134]
MHCRLRQNTAGDNPPQQSGADPVDWAGLPVNLDMVFSQRQRDKVYVQHLMRKRGTRLWRLLQSDSQPCACELAGHGQGIRDAANSMSGQEGFSRSARAS